MAMLTLPILAKESSSTSVADAPKTITIEGNVVDKTTGEALIGACVELDGKKVYTDFDGNFKVETTVADKLVLQTEMVSYQKENLEVKPLENNKLTIQLASIE